MKNKELAVTAQVGISRETLESLLVSAFEGGSNYWCKKVYVIKGEHKDWLSADIAHGRIQTIGVFDAEDGKRYIAHTKDIPKAFEVMSKKYPRHFADILKQDDDADTADVFFQCWVLGDAVYG